MVSNDFMAGSPDPARTIVHDSPGNDSTSMPGESGGAPPEGPSEDAGENGASAARGGLLGIILRFVEEISGAGNGLIEVYADRIRLSVRRKIVNAALGAGLAIGVAVWLGAAALATLRGVCGGLMALWGGREWLGDLTGGLLALALVASAVALYLFFSSRRELGRLKAKYERIRNKHDEKHATAAPAVDDEGAARPRGSPSAPEHRGLGATPG